MQARRRAVPCAVACADWYGACCALSLRSRTTLLKCPKQALGYVSSSREHHRYVSKVYPPTVRAWV
eukprot:1005570-Pleurochrysis_carterae.AAC.8